MMMLCGGAERRNGYAIALGLQMGEEVGMEEERGTAGNICGV